MKTDLKKIFLTGVVGSLCFAALTAISIFLVGKFDLIEFKVLMTTLAIGGASLTGLCDTVLLNRKKGHPVALAGLGLSAMGFVLSLVSIWGGAWNEPLFKTTMDLIILAVAGGHASLLLATCSSENKQVAGSLYVTLFFIGLVHEINSLGDAFLYRGLGIAATLDLLGTLVTPILKRMNS